MGIFSPYDKVYKGVQLFIRRCDVCSPAIGVGVPNNVSTTDSLRIYKMELIHAESIPLALLNH